MKSINLKNVLYLLIALILIVFATSGDLIVYIFSTNKIRTIFSLIALCLIIVSLFIHKSYNTKLLLAVFGLSMIFLRRNYFLMSKEYAFCIIYISMLLLCLLSYKKIDCVDYLLKILMIIYIFYAACTIIFYFTPDFYLNYVVDLFPKTASKLISWYKSGCMAGLTGHYSTNGMFLATGLIISSSLLLKNKKLNYVYVLLTIFLVVALLLTGKRAHIVFSVCAIGVTYFLSTVNFQKKWLKNYLIKAIVILGIFAILFTIFPSLGVVIKRFKDSIMSGNFTENRLMFWKLAINIFCKNFLLGIGWCNFAVASVNSVSTGFYFAYTHNTYLQLLCESGIVGFCAYMSWIVYMLLKTIKLCNIIKKNNELNSKIKFHLTYSLCFQIFFVLYCLTGNPLYNYEMFIPYFAACSLTIYYSNQFLSKDRVIKINE